MNRTLNKMTLILIVLSSLPMTTNAFAQSVPDRELKVYQRHYEPLLAAFETADTELQKAEATLKAVEAAYNEVSTKKLPEDYVATTVYTDALAAVKEANGISTRAAEGNMTAVDLNLLVPNWAKGEATNPGYDDPISPLGWQAYVTENKDGLITLAIDYVCYTGNVLRAATLLKKADTTLKKTQTTFWAAEKDLRTHGLQQKVHRAIRSGGHSSVRKSHREPDDMVAKQLDELRNLLVAILADSKLTRETVVNSQKQVLEKVELVAAAMPEAKDREAVLTAISSIRTQIAADQKVACNRLTRLVQRLEDGVDIEVADIQLLVCNRWQKVDFEVK